MKFSLYVLAFIALVPQAAWSSEICNLSATISGGYDIDRTLVNTDTAAIKEAAKQNHDITGCDVSGITDMSSLFKFNSSFNQDISGWNVSNVTNMAEMFRSATAFNQDISSWNTVNVTNMLRAFTYTRSFNQNISGWNVSNVTSFFHAFESSALDQDISGWDVSSVTSFQGMFQNAEAMWARVGVNVNPTTDQTRDYFSDKTAPTVTLTGPSGVVTAAFAATATFSEAVTGFALDDITVTNGTASSLVTGNAPVYTFTVTPTLGTTVSIGIAANKVTDTAGNANTASNTLSIQAGSPASEFAAKEDAIRSVITYDAQRSLNSTLASNTRLTRDALGRFLTSRTQMQSDGAGLASRNNIAFDVDGIAVATPEQLSTQGVFFAQTGNFEGTKRRLVFGDFDIQRDGDTGSTTATINGKIAWEQMLSEQTMLGYYLGSEVARSNIQGSFTGTQDKYGVSVGGYFVHALQENLFLDGFASLGAGRNNLEMADDTLALTSDYDTRTATMGAAVSGVYEYGQYDFHPELAFSYGKTWIGDVGFTGVAYGLTDDTLSLDTGDVSIANLTLRPEIVWALDAETVADSNTQLSFAPRFICQRTSAAATTQNCGAGAEIGLSSTSEDGLSSANIRLVMDRVGNSNRSSFALNFERSF